jgi:hypothetical protein
VERCREVSQGYAFFAYPCYEDGLGSRTLKGPRIPLPLRWGAVFVSDTVIQGLRSLHSLNPWLPSMHPSGVRCLIEHS